MSRTLLSFRIVYSPADFILPAGLIPSSSLLLYFANLYTGIKLIILLIMFSSLMLISYRILFNPISKVDLLLDINQAIIWHNSQTQLCDIKSMRTIGFHIMIINLIYNNQTIKLLLLPRSIPHQDYKTLQRIIKWKALKSN